MSIENGPMAESNPRIRMSKERLRCSICNKDIGMNRYPDGGAGVLSGALPDAAASVAAGFFAKVNRRV